MIRPTLSPVPARYPVASSPHSAAPHFHPIPRRPPPSRPLAAPALPPAYPTAPALLPVRLLSSYQGRSFSLTPRAFLPASMRSQHLLRRNLNLHLWIPQPIPATIKKPNRTGAIRQKGDSIFVLRGNHVISINIWRAKPPAETERAMDMLRCAVLLGLHGDVQPVQGCTGNSIHRRRPGNVGGYAVPDHGRFLYRGYAPCVPGYARHAALRREVLDRRYLGHPAYRLAHLRFLRRYGDFSGRANA